MDTSQIADLQFIVIAVALIMGAVRGGLGYWFTAPDSEQWDWRKFGKTMVRYAIVNLVSINGLAATGMAWNSTSIVLYTAIQVAVELGFDRNKGRATSTPSL